LLAPYSRLFEECVGADGALGYVAAREYEMLRKTLTILSLIGLLLSVGIEQRNDDH